MNIIDLKPSTVYRLTCDVVNPQPDKRRASRHFHTLAVWPKGLLVYTRFDTYTIADRGFWSVSAQGHYNTVTVAHKGFEGLIAALESVRTLESVLFGARQSSITPADILEELIVSQELILDDIEAAILSLQAKDAADRLLDRQEEDEHRDRATKDEE